MNIGKKSKELHIFQREIYFVIQKVINFSIYGNNKQQSELETIINVPQSFSYSINEEKNFDKFVNEAYNLYPEKSKIIQVIRDENKRCLINNSSIKNNHNIFDFQTYNKIKVLKNNKVVYINKDLLNSYSISRNIKKLKKCL